MDNLAALSRTFNPKYAHYAPDGVGRDSYILCRNGGLVHPESYVVPAVGYSPSRQSPTMFSNNNFKKSTSPKYEFH